MFNVNPQAKYIKGKPRNMIGLLLFQLLLQGVLIYDALGWEVTMPKEIHGLRNSCLVIPCSFSYTSDPPKDPSRVVWYQLVSKGYPLVYDPLYVNNVIDKFKGKTDLYRESGECSLVITTLEQSHHGEKIYAWIDPENVGWRTYAFYDVTSTIFVDKKPQEPSISIYGGEKMGDAITVECSTFHTCPYSKPTITLSGVEGTDQTKDEHIKNGLWKITLTRTGVLKAESVTFHCSVTHYGGITVTTEEVKMSKWAQGVGFWPYIVVSSLVFILICAITGVFIYKRRHRHQSDRTCANMRAEYKSNNICIVSGNMPLSKRFMVSTKE